MPFSLISTGCALIILVSINLLDAYSYGQLVFPSSLLSLFPNCTWLGIQMFLLSTVVSQCVLSGLSSFTGAGVIGGMMLENLPFMQAMAAQIVRKLEGTEQASKILPTVLLCYALNTFLIGASFWLMHRLHISLYLEAVPSLFLRAMVVGIGGYLVIAGMEISIGSGNHPMQKMAVSLLFGVFVFIIAGRWRASFVFPLLVAVLVAVFYLADWLLSLGPDWYLPVTRAPWGIGPFGVLREFSLHNADYRLLMGTLPTQVSSVLFGILHLPINVPLYSAATGQQAGKFSLENEIYCHFWSNILASLGFGLLPNYFVYSSSMLLYRVGGPVSKAVCWLIAIATALTFLPIGSGSELGALIISRIPLVVLGCLVIFCGVDLIFESFAGDRWERCILAVAGGSCVCFGFEVGMALGMLLVLANFLLKIALSSSAETREIESFVFMEDLQLVTKRLVDWVSFRGVIFFLGELKLAHEIRGLGVGQKAFLIFDFSGCSFVQRSTISYFERSFRAEGCELLFILSDKGAGDGEFFCSQGQCQEYVIRKTYREPEVLIFPDHSQLYGLHERVFLESGGFVRLVKGTLYACDRGRDFFYFAPVEIGFAQLVQRRSLTLYVTSKEGAIVETVDFSDTGRYSQSFISLD